MHSYPTCLKLGLPGRGICSMCLLYILFFFFLKDLRKDNGLAYKYWLSSYWNSLRRSRFCNSGMVLCIVFECFILYLIAN